MKRLATIVLALPATAMFAVPPAAAHTARPQRTPVSADSNTDVAGQYIISVKSGNTSALMNSAGISARAVTHVYRHVLHGFSARLSTPQIHKLRSNAQVLRVEHNSTFHITGTQANPPWGLDRTDQRSLPLDHRYTYHHQGAGVTAYVIDTGIDTSDPDFGGRATTAHDATGGNGRDCNGHGTHVAGVIGGKKYGLAKRAKLAAVRVLDCKGSGTNDDVIAGMDWVAGHAHKPAVANMSLGGQRSATVNTAARNLTKYVYLSVAAGNDSRSACQGSPASAHGVMSVAASDRKDHAANFTSYGPCVGVYAPGVAVTSDWLHGGTKTLDGTSMATPHVSGVAAMYESAHGTASQSTVNKWIKAHADHGKIAGNHPSTPNALLNTGGL